MDEGMEEARREFLSAASRHRVEFESKQRIRPDTHTAHIVAGCDVCKEMAKECFWGLYFKVPKHDEPTELHGPHLGPHDLPFLAP